MIGFLILVAMLYFFTAYCIYAIAQKFEAHDKSRAWIPLINILLLCEIAERPGYYLLLMFVPLANLYIWASLWMDVAGGLGRNRYLGVLAIMPPLNLIMIGYLAFSIQPQSWRKP